VLILKVADLIFAGNQFAARNQIGKKSNTLTKSLLWVVTKR
jgi:hypothetical protein